MIEESKIVDLFRELKSSTNNFKDISPEIIRNNPSIVIILRVLLGKSQIDFSKLCNCGKSTISMWENCLSKPHGEKLTNIISIIKNIMSSSDISEERIIKSFRDLKDKQKSVLINNATRTNKKLSFKERQIRSINGILGHQKTEDEILISKILTDNNIKFSEQFTIINPGITRAGSCTVDFLITHKEQVIILETTTLNLKTKKLDRAIRLAHRSFRIKKHFPTIKTVCFIRTNLEYNHKALHVLMEAFDKIIINDISKIVKIINEIALEEGFEPPKACACRLAVS